MAGSDSSKDTQEQKPRLNQTDLPSCLNLDVLTKKQWAKSTEDPKGSVIFSCMKLPKDENPGEERICPKYTCVYGPTQRKCSAINFIQIYYLIQCSKAGQELQQQQLESLKCWAKNIEDPKDLDLCCSPEVLEKATAMYIEKFLNEEHCSSC